MFLVTLITFLLINAMPGSVIEARLQDSPGVSDELVQRLTREFGLDDPVPVRYAKWLGNALTGDLGESFFTNETVAGALKRTFPVTFELAVIATLTGLLIAIPFGILAAVSQDRPADYLTRLVSVGALAVPNFLIATLFVVYASVWLGYTLPLRYENIWENPGSNLQVMFIAAMIIGFSFSGGAARLTRSAMLEVLRQDYMRTARAKGLSGRTVVVAHGLRNAALPVLTVVGLQFAGLLSGTIIIETIFSLPGIGQLLIQSITTRDFPVVQGVILFFGFALILTNLVVDIGYTYLDPRVRVHG